MSFPKIFWGLEIDFNAASEKEFVNRVDNLSVKCWAISAEKFLSTGFLVTTRSMVNDNNVRSGSAKIKLIQNCH